MAIHTQNPTSFPLGDLLSYLYGVALLSGEALNPHGMICSDRDISKCLHSTFSSVKGFCFSLFLRRQLESWGCAAQAGQDIWGGAGLSFQCRPSTGL